MNDRNYYHDYLMHYGILGMKWGKRKTKKMQKMHSHYLDKTQRTAETHRSNARAYSESAKKLKSMSDSDYAKRFDDKEYLELLGGAKKAKAMEIKENERRARDSFSYAKQWADIHDEIMNTPVEKLRSNKDYQKLVNEYLNKYL